jgi:hypothetical protein
MGAVAEHTGYLNPFPRTLRVWAPDPLEKAFRHTTPPPRAPRQVALEAGCKAYEAVLQAAIREVHAIGPDCAADEKIRRLQISMTNSMTMLLNTMSQ